MFLLPEKLFRGVVSQPSQKIEVIASRSFAETDPNQKQLESAKI
jgi:hypothetical protein